MALGLMLLVSLASYLLLAHQPLLQAALVIVSVLLYIGWGFLHHLRLGNVSFGIMVEYVLVGVLVVTLVLGNLWLL